MNAGIVYLSFGQTYADCTIAALESKAKNAPLTPAMVLTNRRQDLESKLCKRLGVRVQFVEAPDIDVRTYKTQIYKYSPFEYTLLLDADAWINTELFNEFHILDHTPLALTHAFHHPSIGTAGHWGAEDRAHTLKALGGMQFIPQYASGVMFFRRDDPTVRRLFDAWCREWQIFRGKDQSALIRAIIKEQVFPLVLAQKHWLTARQGEGFISHRFDKTLPSMPRKDAKSPLRNKFLP